MGCDSERCDQRTVGRNGALRVCIANANHIPSSPSSMRTTVAGSGMGATDAAIAYDPPPVSVLEGPAGKQNPSTNSHSQHLPRFVRPAACTRVSSRPLPAQTQPFFLIQPVHPLMIHDPSFTLQQNINPIIAVAKLCNYLLGKISSFRIAQSQRGGLFFACVSGRQPSKRTDSARRGSLLRAVFQRVCEPL